MSPAHIRTTPKGKYQVRYRQGGRGNNIRSAGTFRTKKAANDRRVLVESWLAKGLDVAAELEKLATPEKAPTLAEVAASWQTSRIDVKESTANVHRKSLVHVLARFGERDPATITPGQVAEWVGELSRENPPVPTGYRKRTKPYEPGSVGKFRDTLAMVLGYAGIHPNPARDERVKLPRQARKEVRAPEADAVEAVLGATPRDYRLPILVLEATAMRVGELETLRWADLDTPNARWRVALENEKGDRGRWVPVPVDVFAAVDALVPREDRVLELPVFAWLNQAALRRVIARAAKATGTPLWSPHGLRRRRISLWHRAGHSWAQIGEWAGQRDLSITANVYTRVIVGPEIDRSPWLSANPGDEPVMTWPNPDREEA